MGCKVSMFSLIANRPNGKSKYALAKNKQVRQTYRLQTLHLLPLTPLRSSRMSGRSLWMDSFVILNRRLMDKQDL